MCAGLQEASHGPRPVPGNTAGSFRFPLGPPPRRHLTIIIPVFNAAKELRRCLTSLFKHSDNGIRKIVINDASTDSNVLTVIKRFRAISDFSFYENEHNHGFTKTVNRGIELAGRSDVIVLNADTEVTPGWIRGLRFAAYSSKRIGIATPLSNSASHFSIPRLGDNPIPYWMSIDSYARSVAHSSEMLIPSTPTAHGFCMFIKREFLDDIGTLDSAAFPIGYGEEVDLSMRGLRRGWYHVVADNVFVFHVNAASFGASKQERIKSARRVIDQRYPEYSLLLKDFRNGDAMRRVRARSLGAWSPTAQALPRVLIAVSAGGSETGALYEDLMHQLAGSFDLLLLVSDGTAISLYKTSGRERALLESSVLEHPVSPVTHRSDHYDQIVFSWLVRYSIEVIHVLHIAKHSLSLPAMSKEMGIPVAFSFLDFYAVCPMVDLLDENEIFCGGICTETKGECINVLWPGAKTPPLKHCWVQSWRDQVGASIADCNVFFSTSDNAKKLLEARFSFLRARPFVTVPYRHDSPHAISSSPMTSYDDRQIVSYYSSAYKSLLQREPSVTFDRGALEARQTRSPSTRLLRVGLIVQTYQGDVHASAHTRLLAPLSHPRLQDKVSLGLIDQAAMRRISDFDVLVVQSTAIEEAGCAASLCREINRSRVPMVVDIDRGLRRRKEEYPKRSFPAPRWHAFGTLLDTAARVCNSVIYGARWPALNVLLESASEIWASTEALARVLELPMGEYRVIESSLDRRIWERAEAEPVPRPARDACHFLCQGLGAQDKQLGVVMEALDRLYDQQVGEFDLTLIGASRMIKERPWLQCVSPPRDLAPYPALVSWMLGQGPFDVGLAPLMDTPTSRFVTDVNLLVYAAMKVAPLASDATPYRGEMLRRGLYEVVGAGVEDWGKALGVVVTNPTDYQERGQRIHDYLWSERESGSAAKKMEHALFEISSR